MRSYFICRLQAIGDSLANDASVVGCRSHEQGSMVAVSLSVRRMLSAQLPALHCR